MHLATALALAATQAFADEAFLDARLEADVRARSLWQICSAIKRPCGQYSIMLNDPRLQNWPNSDESIRGRLDSFVARTPAYRWALVDGVINIAPKQSLRGDRLDRRIEKLSLRNMSSTRAAIIVLLEARLLGSFQSPGNFRLRHVDLELKDVTVREALNRIVSEDGQAMWMLWPSRGRPGKLDLFLGVYGEKGMTSADYGKEMALIRQEIRKLALE